MALLLWLLVALVPCLIGMGTLRLLYGSHNMQENSLVDCVLTGGMICIGLAEAAHLGAVMLGWSFSRCVNVFWIAVAVAAAVSVVAGVALPAASAKGTAKASAKAAAKGTAKGKKVAESGAQPGRKKSLLFGASFSLLVLLQFIYVFNGQGVYVGGDITLETVTSFLETDRVYQVNPLTGQAYTLGMPLRLRILCLPTLYGAISSLFGLEPELLIYRMVPAFVLLASYLAYFTVAKALFPSERAKQLLFMVLTAIVIFAGDYLYGMDGFGLLHSGFRGVTIRSAVLLPYVFGLLLRKKYKGIFLCVLAEACMVWTLYGLGACVLVTTLWFAVEVVRRHLRGIGGNAKKDEGREEGSVCGKS